MVYRLRAHLAASPGVDAFARSLLALFPLLDRRLRSAVRSERSVQAEIQEAQARVRRRGMPDLWPQARPRLDTFQAAQSAAHLMANLSPRARSVYLDLMKALESRP